jgi:hypothetical protein
MIVLSHVERCLIYEAQRDFFYIGQRGGRLRTRFMHIRCRSRCKGYELRKILL